MTTAWLRFKEILKSKGLKYAWVCEQVALSESGLRGMFKGKYGCPDTPEKRRKIVAALNLGPGKKIRQMDIWMSEPTEAA